jgi:hypothetical protein
MDDLVDQIAKTQDEQVLEALSFIAESLQITPDPQILAALAPEQEGKAATRDLANLARVALSAAALHDETGQEVTLALGGAGRKQFILGGAGEVALLAALAISLVHVIISRGLKSDDLTITIEEKDGRTITHIKHIREYGISSLPLAKAIRQAIPGNDGSQPGGQ